MVTAMNLSVLVSIVLFSSFQCVLPQSVNLLNLDYLQDNPRLPPLLGECPSASYISCSKQYHDCSVPLPSRIRLRLEQFFGLNAAAKLNLSSTSTFNENQVRMKEAARLTDDQKYDRIAAASRTQHRVKSHYVNGGDTGTPVDWDAIITICALLMFTVSVFDVILKFRKFLSADERDTEEVGGFIHLFDHYSAESFPF